MPPADLTAPSGHSSDAGAGQGFAVSWVDLLFCAGVMLAGFCFLRDAPYWARNTYVGNAQYGDAEFWWNGALHFSHGIIAENPNLTYRMGYAALGGLIAAACGPDYLLFHHILLGLFLIAAGGLYFSLRDTVGRIAAAAAVLFLVFNPFTAEWIAVSTSDGLGMILNLGALLCLIAGVRGRLKLGWIALFGLLFSCGSLTRPLMTPFILPAAIAVLASAWGKWRRAALGLGVMLAAFLAPTLAWMSLMAVTTGNFALTGASQDSSTFYAASDPQIQVWRGDMFAKVRESAQRHFHVAEPSGPQINAEFWTLTRENYRHYWRYHFTRLWPHTLQLAGYTHARSAYATPASNRFRTWAQWALVLGLVGAALWRRRWAAAGAVALLGWVWAAHPQLQPWAVIVASAIGLLGFFFNQRAGFLWAAYWWVGVFALYLIGGTWGSPTGAMVDLNALGYRLGFQFFFVADLLVIIVLGGLAQGALRRTSVPSPEVSRSRLTCASPAALRLVRIFLSVAALALAVLLVCGAVIVGSRLIARNRAKPVPYPALGTLAQSGPVQGAQPTRDLTDLMVNLNAHAGTRLIVNAMSSGFVWNLPGQQRCILLLYRQDFVEPVQMSPRRFDVEVSRQLPEKEWMGRQGAWVIRPFPDTAQLSNLPYYLEMSAVQAFIPLTADGKAYDPAKIVIFPLAKSATQLTASGELTFHGATPEWSLNSGSERYPRRFALRPAGPASSSPGFSLKLDHARGNKTLRLGVQLEAAAGSTPRPPNCSTQLVSGPEAGGRTLWQTSILAPPADIQWTEIPLADATGTIHFSCKNLQPGDTLWVYELVLTADDFTK
jgi:hypothetical protein